MRKHDLRCRAGPPAAPSVGPARGGGGVDVAGGATPPKSRLDVLLVAWCGRKRRDVVTGSCGFWMACL